MTVEVALIVISVLASTLIGLFVWIIQTSRTDVNRQRELWHERFNTMQVTINKLVAELAELRGMVLADRAHFLEQRREDRESRGEDN